jgi:glucose/arabinose dehydrogenase
MTQRTTGRSGFNGLCAWALGLALVGLASCGGGGGDGDDSGTEPQASLTAPADFASDITGNLILEATASDDVGVARVEFQVDGVAVGSDATEPFQVAVNTDDYASGQHVVRARAVDGEGRLSGWSSATVSFGGSRTQPAGFTRSDVLAGLTNATAFAQAPDGRWFVAEQGGTLRVVAANGTLLATPFVTLTVDSSDERGLLGVALHPEFGTNPDKRWVYLYYTTPEGGVHNRISRFTQNPSSPNIASVGSVPIADLPALSATNHNGGALHFGSDGKLYAGVGDNNVGDNAQSLSTPLGKLLRFNEDGSIPTDNPFNGSASGLNRAIWALGLRNPFTFAVQPGTGRIHINDVGQDTWEEIDLGAAGADYGWPVSEGPDNVGSFTGPLFAYKHSETVPPGSGPGGFFTGCSIAGGTFYPEGGNFPAAYPGSYFFADFCSRFIGRLDLANGNAAYAFGSVSGNPVDMQVGSDGALYVLTRGGITRFRAP